MITIKNTKDLKQEIKNSPLGDYFVWWDDIEKKDVKELEKVVENSKDERALQKFLEKNPLFLIQHLSGGGGRWVLPQQKLGAEYVTDFIIGEKHSFGYNWQAVELENPKAKMFTKSGDPTKELTHAIRQIQDWRAWLKRNQNYASRPKVEGGLELTDIDASLPGLILIGRHKDVQITTNDRRGQMVSDLNIKIHSYDSLIDWAQGRVLSLEKRK